MAAVPGVSSAAPAASPPPDDQPLDLVHAGADLPVIVAAVQAHPDQARAAYDGLVSAGRYSDARSLADAVPGADGGQGFWSRSWTEVRAAAAHPGDALIGAGKGVVNTVSDVGTLLMKGSALQSAGESDRAAGVQSLFGQTEAAKRSQAGADMMRAAAAQAHLPTLPFTTPAQAGGDKIATAAMTVADGVGVYKGVAGALARAGTRELVDAAHVAELGRQGVKFTAADLVATGKTAEGRVVFLERGGPSAGLQHIVEQHGADFARIGVAEKDIPRTVMEAVTEGKVVGYQGRGTARPIYEVTVNGHTQRIAVTTGSNGFIVGANPAGSVK